MIKPYYQDDQVTIYHGNAIDVLPELPPVDLVLTDPPYSSGGAFRSDRSAPTTAKYVRALNFQNKFSGDNRDQRSFERWCYYWSSDCLGVTRDGGALLSFIDWRNLPTMIDAVQVGGWVYRGIVPWDKTEATRPVKGWFRSQVEYIVTATKGAIDRDHNTDGVCQPGYIRCPAAPDEKIHETQKPLQLITMILQTRADWQIVLDPFMGSGTTLRSAKDIGRKAIGIEIEEKLCERAALRCSQDVFNFSATEASNAG